jgi:chromosomal replication initiator protein
MAEVWKKTLGSLRERLDRQQYDHWFKPIVCEEETDNTIVLQVPDRYFRSWLESNYLAMLKDELREQTHRDVDIQFTYRESTPISAPARKRPVGPETLPIDRRYTFDTYVVGDSNHLAHAACAAIADAPGETYNPLFIYGGVGLGKTHLLHSVANQIRAERPNAKIQYFAAESYINDLVQSIRTDRMDDFRRRYRQRCDVLLVDDIQFLAGKERTQVEFFHTFNSLYADRKQIVLTSDRAPSEIANLEDRLKSRFQWGLIADVQLPDYETRLAILRSKAAAEQIELPNEVAEFVARHIKSNVRDLEGCLVRLSAHSRLTRQPIEVAMTRHVLRDLLVEPAPTLTIPQIQKTVANFYNVTVSDLKGPRRHRAIAFPRMIAMYLAREHTPCSYPEIGKRFGNRDHSTVISAVKKITKGVDTTDHAVMRALTDIRKMLNVG